MDWLSRLQQVADPSGDLMWAPVTSGSFCAIAFAPNTVRVSSHDWGTCCAHMDNSLLCLKTAWVF